MKKTYLVPQTEIDELSSKYLCDENMGAGSQTQHPDPRDEDSKEDFFDEVSTNATSIWG